MGAINLLMGLIMSNELGHFLPRGPSSTSPDRPTLVSTRLTPIQTPVMNATESHRPQVMHSKLCSITHVATKVHVIIRSHVVLTWMYGTVDLV